MLLPATAAPKPPIQGDNKGQHFAQLLAIESWLAVAGQLPCNVIVLLEGEEEIGSPHIADFVGANRDILNADLVVTADGASAGAGVTVRLAEVADDGEPGPPVIGDWVGLDLRQDTAVVRVIAPRTSLLARRRPGAAERPQLLAANVDLVLLVESLEPGPSLRRVERGVAMARLAPEDPYSGLADPDLLCRDIVDLDRFEFLAHPHHAGQLDIQPAGNIHFYLVGYHRGALSIIS